MPNQPSPKRTLTVSHGNILAVYFMASDAEKVAGNAWYNDARDIAIRIGNDCGISVAKAAGVISALSPNNRWERNVIDARQVCELYARTQPENLTQFSGHPIKVCTYGANLQKAEKILLLDPGAGVKEICSILNGLKTSAFFQCIVGVPHKVVVDVHSYSVWAGKRYTSRLVPSSLASSRSTYERICEDYDTALEYIKQVDHDPLIQDWGAAQLQATTWLTWRRLIKENQEMVNDDA